MSKVLKPFLILCFVICTTANVYSEAAKPIEVRISSGSADCPTGLSLVAVDRNGDGTPDLMFGVKCDGTLVNAPLSLTIIGTLIPYNTDPSNSTLVSGTFGGSDFLIRTYNSSNELVREWKRVTVSGNIKDSLWVYPPPSLTISRNNLKNEERPNSMLNNVEVVKYRGVEFTQEHKDGNISYEKFTKMVDLMYGGKKATVNETTTNDNRIQIVPNPSVSSVQVTLPNSDCKSNSYTLVDINGKVVGNTPLTTIKDNSTVLQFDINNLVQGTYFVSVNRCGLVETIKFVKE